MDHFVAAHGHFGAQTYSKLPIASDDACDKRRRLLIDSRACATALGGGTQGPPTREEIEAFARDWYRMFDEHVPVDEIALMVVDDGLEYIVPEATLRSRNEFRQWYEGGGDYPGVINLYFDEVHTLARVSGLAERPRVEVVVNWQLRRWRPPAPRSEWLGFDAFQIWDIVRSPETGKVGIARYVVDELRRMPGSPML